MLILEEIINNLRHLADANEDLRNKISKNMSLITKI